MIMSVHTAVYIRKESRITIAAAKCVRKGAKKMIKIEKVSIHGLEETIRGMRNPMNSWDKSDSWICKGGDDGIGCENCAKEVPCEHTYDHSFQLGKADHELMMKLAAGGPVHAKYRRMITVYLDITAPLYWWKEFDTYKVGTVANSCSTMHKIHAKEFTLEDFSHEHLIGFWETPLRETIEMLNKTRDLYLESNKKDKELWYRMIQLLPSSYNQKRTVMLNYEVLVGIYRWRKDHKLDEWREFCRWIKQLPYSEIITGDSEKMYADGKEVN
jgi:hypothetical protein